MRGTGSDWLTRFESWTAAAGRWLSPVATAEQMDSVRRVSSCVRTALVNIMIYQRYSCEGRDKIKLLRNAIGYLERAIETVEAGT